MDYLNGLNYKWVYYGSELFGNHVRRIAVNDKQIGVGRDNWPPQGNRNTAEKLAPSVWLIDSLTDHGPNDTYFCWFLVTIDHEQRSLFYQWVKGDMGPHSWTFNGFGKNAAIIFEDCKSHTRPAPRGYYEGNTHVIHIEPIINIAKTISGQSI